MNENVRPSPRHAAVPPGVGTTATDGATRRRWRADALVVVAYCVLAVICFWDLWTKGLSHTYLYENDGIQMMWFLNWVPYALGHGLNPFHSALVNVPHGVNLLQQTSSEFLGLVLSPVTVLFGATATFNFGETLALAGSATSMYFVVRRFIDWRPAAFLAGLLYGFGPYEIGQGSAHLNLSFVVLPPIILLLAHDIAVKGDGRARRRGVVLALLLVAEFFTSTEIFVTTTMMGILLVAAIALWGRRWFLQRLATAARGFAWAIGIAVVVLAYPAWYALAGPEHVNGAIQVTALIRADLFGLFVPDGLMHFAPSSFVSMANRFAGNWNENGSYLGFTLIALLVAGIVWLRRRTEVQVVAVLGLIALVFSFGQKLVIRSAPTALPNGAAVGKVALPWDLVAHVPILRNLLPARFSLYVTMAVAFVLATITECLYQRARDRRGTLAATLVPTGLAAVALFPLVPAVPFAFVRPVPTTTYFSSRFARELPTGKVAVLYPYPSAAIPGGALWQTQSDMRFAMPGGYFLVPGPNGTLATSPVAFNAYPTAFGNALSDLYLGKTPPHSAAQRRAMRDDLRTWHAQSVVAIPTATSAAGVVAYISWVLDTGPVHQADAYTWYDVGAQLRG
ncbi:MAG: hypothetical protein ACRDVW_03660 [Acidimicrobiales bacterium]